MDDIIIVEALKADNRIAFRTFYKGFALKRTFVQIKLLWETYLTFLNAGLTIPAPDTHHAYLIISWKAGLPVCLPRDFQG